MNLQTKQWEPKQLRKVFMFFSIVLINASISYVSRVVLLLPLVPVATTNVENIIKTVLSMKTTPVGD